jgi:PAS domain S-box-containing protein
LQLTVGAVPLLVIAGALLFQIFHTAIVSASPMRQPSARWWLAFVIGALLFVIARLVQRCAVEPDLGHLGSRAQFVLGVWFPVIGIAALEAHLGRPLSRELRLIAAAALVLAVLVLATDWIVVDRSAPRIDLLGERYYATHVGPGGAALSGLWVAMAVLATRRVRALTMPSERWQIRAMALSFVITGVNDTLLAAGVIRSLHLFEYTLIMPSALSVLHLIRTSVDTQASLASTVAARTAALATTGQALDRARDELSDSERRFRQLADATREGVLVLDGERALDTNRALRAMCGLPEDAGPLPLAALFAEQELVAVHNLIAEGGGRILTTTARRADGETFPVEVAAPAAATGAPRVLLVRDVTAQQELQRQVLRADRLAAMGTLAASTAHEINNPLTYVLTNAELLALELDGHIAAHPSLAPTRELAADIVSGATRVAVIVRDMVKVARDQIAGTEAVDLAAVVRESLAMVANQLRHRATVVLDLADLPPVRGDKVRLGQVFVNLLINASQAIPDGHADRNEVRIATAMPGPGWLTVRVTDTGVGMTPAVRERIFDPFFTTKQVGEGTGLGLAVTLGIVSGLGGRIEVESELGRGTTFTVWLPAAPTTPRAAPAPAPTTTTPSPPARADAATTSATAAPARVLIVDDDPRVARTFARLLPGYDVELVGSGREAIDRCRAQPYDAVICDLMMPETTGMGVHSALCASQPDLAARMVFVTGGAFTDEARAFLDAVPNLRLSKPVSADELRAAVREVVAQARRTPAP